MAIVKMKKLRVVAMAEERDELLGELLRLGCVEISEPDGQLEDLTLSAPLARNACPLMDTKGSVADVTTALGAIQRYAAVKDGMFIKRKPVKESEFHSADSAEQAKGTCEKINGLLAQLYNIQCDEGRAASQAAALTPWKDLDFPLETQDTAHVVFRMLVCPAATDVGALRAELVTENLAAELYPVGADKTQQYLFLICHRADEAAAMEILRRASFSVVTFPDYIGTPAKNLEAIACCVEEARAQQERITDELAACGGARDALRLHSDRLNTEAAQDEDARRILTDGTIVFFEGWVPAEAEGNLASLLEKRVCAWETAEPSEEEYPDVPVQLKNNWLTKPLNMVTDMYSLPAYGSLDPNPLMAPFFILFYGIMMADMGYGLLMLLASSIVLKKYRPKGGMEHFFGLMRLCGVSVFIMGALTGGFFGDFLTQLVGIISPGTVFTLPALFTPLDDTLMILIGSMCLGFVQINVGMAISFYKKLKRGQMMDALWEEVTWWIVFLGGGLAALGVTKLVLLVGGVMVLVGSGWNAKGFGKVGAVFGSLYNHVTGYFGDILSYSRLMALMLAGSVIAQVFNTLGAIPGNVVVFLIISLAGNALNFALNLLGCYVHDLRLQCLEYFNKFYEDGGKRFRPLEIKTKYVDIVKE
ncbi:V-type ATPase 116kDa subunit family protein [Oscillibacter sp.]|uniref:V-type ATP synthase subunit I n=1 Tax=Oscillibacter sp. TaxID=1945593 RepID=UPI002896C5D8|nr:V-type ATPase 116kDa subunit family protein [Oscillibacter sp.]